MTRRSPSTTTDSLNDIMDWALEWQNNPLGYTRHRNGTIVKHWTREEAEQVFTHCGLPVVEYFKVPRIWERPEATLLDIDGWFHGWVLSPRRPVDAPA